jgi:hypothetical protein
MHVCVPVSSLHASNRGNSVNAFLVGRINALGRINGGPLKAIKHDCLTHQIENLRWTTCGAKLEDLSSGPLEINHMEETIEATWTLSEAALMACLRIFNSNRSGPRLKIQRPEELETTWSGVSLGKPTGIVGVNKAEMRIYLS